MWKKLPRIVPISYYFVVVFTIFMAFTLFGLAVAVLVALLTAMSLLLARFVGMPLVGLFENHFAPKQLPAPTADDAKHGDASDAR
jgi:MFS superfamily sulfate permease-like transporter